MSPIKRDGLGLICPELFNNVLSLLYFSCQYVVTDCSAGDRAGELITWYKLNPVPTVTHNLTAKLKVSRQYQIPHGKTKRTLCHPPEGGHVGTSSRHESGWHPLLTSWWRSTLNSRCALPKPKCSRRNHKTHGKTKSHGKTKKTHSWQVAHPYDVKPCENHLQVCSDEHVF